MLYANLVSTKLRTNQFCFHNCNLKVGSPLTKLCYIERHWQACWVLGELIHAHTHIYPVHICVCNYYYYIHSYPIGTKASIHPVSWSLGDNLFMRKAGNDCLGKTVSDLDGPKVVTPWTHDKYNSYCADRHISSAQFLFLVFPSKL